MQRERVTIFGCKGQLGVELMAEFAARGHEVTGFARETADITQASAVDECVAKTNPTVVINAAAYNLVDAAEKEPQAAFLVNGLAVRNLAVACRAANARLVHFSTDYVFDGLAGRSYVETDQPHPVGAYAVSKLAGELYARAYLDAPLVIRTSGVFGPGGLDTARGNFVETMLKIAGQGKPLQVIDDLVASPTYAPALAARSADLVERGIAGIIHAGGGEPISWFDWASKIFKAAGLTPPMAATSEQAFKSPAKRPKFSALSNAKMESLGIAPMPALDEAIRDYMVARRGLAART